MPRPYWNLAIGLAPDEGQRLERRHGPVAVPELAPVDRLPLPSSRPGAMESPQKAQCNGQPGREVARVELLSAFTVRGILGRRRVFGSPRACLGPFSYLFIGFSEISHENISGVYERTYWGFSGRFVSVFFVFLLAFLRLFQTQNALFESPFCVLVSPCPDHSNSRGLFYFIKTGGRLQGRISCSKYTN